jgi:signal transduction histidine kinase
MAAMKADRESPGAVPPRRFLASRKRALQLTVPIHVLAFAFLYIATDRLLQQEVVAMAETMAGDLLSETAEEVAIIGRAHTPDAARGHLFGALGDAHQDINFRLYLSGGSSVGPDAPPSEVERREIAEFLSSGEVQRFKLVAAGQRYEVRGWERIVADAGCASCHRPGETLAIASMAVDLTDRISEVRAGSRRNLALLILVWAVALGASTVIVQRSVRRSMAHVEAELAAAEAGDTAPIPQLGEVSLDPVAAQLYDSLRHFLKRQRTREAQVASRLEHTNQLASLGQLAAGLAHEIKNPLAGIQGALEIMRQDLEKETDRELCGEMLTELKRVDDIMKSLLSSAKPSPPQRRPTDLHGLLDDLERLMSPGLRRRGVTLTVEAASGLIEARVDPAKIRQVLLNLVGNAADALTGGGHIVLRAGPFPDGGGAIVTVEDDGPGMAAEVADKIFEPFFTTKFSGTGLGLAIARSLIQQHGGRLEFETEAGKGTTFYVLIPDNHDEASDASTASADDIEAGA